MSASLAPPLRQVLQSIHTLADIPCLVARLGAEPRWEPIEPDGGQRFAALAGESTRTMWLCATTPQQPLHELRRWSRQLQRRAIRAVLLVFDESTRTLALSLAGASAELVVECNEPSPVELGCLERFASAVAGRPELFERAAEEALSGQGVGKAFFAQFLATLDGTARGMVSRARGVDRRTLALIQLTRVLFLQFVQAKGWLDGDRDYLARRVDQLLIGGEALHTQLFKPLFFGVLNQPVRQRHSRLRRLGNIPYLNGGLFEPHPLEATFGIDIPDDLWREAFDRLFSRFHFTVAESVESGPCIAPDMLGRVFEGVMELGERKRSGTYYTPQPLVRELVRRALSACLENAHGVPRHNSAEHLDHLSTAERRTLARVTVLDPACGSGAFLLGALETLADIRAAEGPPAHVRRNVLLEQIHGADIDPMAVRLAELRLWLALVAPDGADDVAEIAPLPNLDGVVRQGDSLREPYHRLRVGPAVSLEVRRLRTEIAVAAPSERKVALRRLRRLEYQAALAHADRDVAHAQRALTELLATAAAPALFRDSAGDQVPLRARGRELQAQLARVVGARERLLRERSVPWLAYSTNFADVMSHGGFGMVVGNPPWVRAEQLAPEVREELAERYRCWTSGSGNGFRHLPDLSVAFVERGLELVRPGGVVAMLVPAKLATNAYAAALRARLSTTCRLHLAAPVPDAKQFDATVYPMALVVGRDRGSSGNRVSTSLTTSAERPQAEFGAAPWMLRKGANLESLTTLQRRHGTIGDRFHAMLGVKTGADRVFLDPAIEAGCLTRPALRGRDLRPFSPTAGTRLLWCYDRRLTPLTVLPESVAVWIERYREQLEARADRRPGPPWQLFRVKAARPCWRVVWRDISRRLEAAVLTDALDEAIPLNTCYVVEAGSDRAAYALAAWLNSGPVRQLASSIAPVAAGGFRRHAAHVVSALPLPATILSTSTFEAFGRSASAGVDCTDELDKAAQDALAPAHAGASPPLALL